MRVFLAGATGVVGKPLLKKLVERGHSVTATTTQAAKMDGLRRDGASPVLVDGLDAPAIGRAVSASQPEVIIHQMTALGGPPDLRHFDRWFATTNALRTKGTDALVSAARAVGTQRVIAQSYAGWNNQRGNGSGRLATEDDPFDVHPAKHQTKSLAAIRYLERTILDSPLEGTVLRFGNFYGPRATDSLVRLVRKRLLPIIGGGMGVWSWIHVDDAAAATVAALEGDNHGVFNIVDDDPAEVSTWLPYLAEVVGGRPPRRIPVWLGRVMAGEVAVRWMTEARGASNARAGRELAWSPAWPSWRDGFRTLAGSG